MSCSAFGSIMLISSVGKEALTEALNLLLEDLFIPGPDFSHTDTYHGTEMIARTYLDYVPNSGYKFINRTYHTKPGSSPFEGVLVVQFLTSKPVIKNEVELKYLIRDRSLTNYDTGLDIGNPDNTINWNSGKPKGTE